MKNQLNILKTTFFILMLLLSANAYSQTTRRSFVEGGMKKYSGTEVGKFDKHNELGAKDLDDYDIKRMLEIAGITSYTEKLKERKETSISFIIDEYKDSNIVKSDTFNIGNNTFPFFSGDTIYHDYFDTFRMYIHAKEKEAIAYINTPGVKLNYILKHRNDTIQEYFYELRKWEYPDNYNINKRKNILTYASMWKDKEHGFYRFCGVSVLKENDEDSEELLNNSPHYFTIGYILQ